MGKKAIGSKAILVLALFLLLMPAGFAQTTVSMSWTEWKNRDSPSGLGDYETLADMAGVCATPYSIECQTVAGVDYRQAGQKVTCSPTTGLICLNAENNGSCLDYRVRFLCPSDNTPPDISASSSANSANPSEVQITATASDASGIYEIRIFVAGSNGIFAPFKTCSMATSCSFTQNYSPGSTYYYYATAKDNSDNKNEASSPTKSFTVPATPQNRAPVISGFSAPTNLNVGQEGTWKITASDPEGGYLSYTVVWGDEQGSTLKEAAKTLSAGQTATFTHVYYSAGNYNPTFTVTDDKGATAQTSASVNVGSVVPSTCSRDYTIIPGGESLSVGTSGHEYKVRLADVDVSARFAFFDVLDANGNVLKSGIQVNAGSQYSYAAPNGDMIKISVCQVAPSFTLHAKWASIQLTLTEAPQPTGQADLAVDSMSIQPTDTVSSDGKRNMRYVVNVRNVGTATSDQYGYVVYVDGAFAQSGDAVPALTPGAVQTIQMGGPYSPGTHTIKFVLKPYGKDANSANNEMSKEFYVQPSSQSSLWADIKVNGQDKPSSVKYNDTITVSWSSNGDYCLPSGHNVLLADGGLWTGQGKLPASGSMTLLAAHQLGYFSQLEMAIQCYRYGQTDSASDSVTVPVYEETSLPLPTEKVTVNVAGRAIKGSTGSVPVTIVEFSEFPGPFDQRVQSTLRQIAGNYNSLSINFVHMNFPLTSLYPEAQKAAEAVECAGDQGRYWEMHDKIFENVKTDSDTLFSDASAVGLDLNRFKDCLASGSKSGAVAAQLSEASRIGLSGTPSFIIGTKHGDVVTGYKLTGAQPYSEFSAIIDKVMNEYYAGNRAPVISGVSGPTNLQVGEQGTWKITASDPEGGYLSYTVVWGDEQGSTLKEAAKPLSAGQTATFTHTYYSTGTFQPRITVTDDHGMTAATSLTVFVGSGEPGALVSVEVNAEPYEVNLYDTYKVTGKITYSASSGGGSSQRFKVVTSSTPLGTGRLSEAPKATIKPEEKGEGSVVDSIVKYIMGNSGESAVSPATATTDSASSQERIDYVTLSPGESTTLAAYFTARTPGTHVARVRVYAEKVSPCVVAPCPVDYKLVAQGSAKVVVKKAGPVEPPLPPLSEVRLRSGWNMVSVPSGSQISMEEVSDSCGTNPYAWRLTATGYVKDSSLYPGYGYWVYSPRECKASMHSYSTTVPQMPIELFAGWNLLPGSDDSTPFSSYTTDCQVVSGPWYYSHDARDSKGRPTYIYATNIEPGKAYWLNVAQSCTLKPPELQVAEEKAPPAPPASQ